MSDVRDGRIIGLYQAGARIDAIIDEVGVSKTLIYRVLKRNDVGLRQLDEERIIELYQAGTPVASIASITKSSWTSIYRLLDQRGVPRRKGLDADRQERIVELYREGVTIPEIGRQVECGISSIWRVLRREDVPRRRPHVERAEPLSRRGHELQAAYESGQSLPQIAEVESVSAAAVRNILLRRGVKLREAGGRSPRVFTAPELARIRSLREAGKSIFDITGELRTHHKAVRAALMDMGLAARPRKPRTIGAGGYAFIRNADGESVAEHRHVMAESLGRPLRSTETVHHIDGNVTNNDLSNLQLRQGKHGKGVVMTCNSCGSHDISAAELASA